MSMSQLKQPAAVPSDMHPNLERDVAVLNAEFDAHKLDDTKVHGGLKESIDKLEKRFDSFDAKLWALVVMVAIGLLIFAIQEVVK